MSLKKFFLTMIVTFFSFGVNFIYAKEMPWCWGLPGFPQYSSQKYERTGQKYERTELIQKSVGWLRYLRNQIFAHYGRSFKDPLLQEYFHQQPWYKINSNYSDHLLSELDFENIRLIFQIEKEIKEKFSQQKHIPSLYKKLKKQGLFVPPNLRITELFQIDLNQDGKKETILGTLDWCSLGFRGPIDPPWYDEITFFESKDNHLVEISKPSKKWKYSGWPFDKKIPYREGGTKYIKFGDMNKNGILEIYFQEFGPGPDVLNIYEMQQGKIVSLFSDSLVITKIVDLDDDGVVEIIHEGQYENTIGYPGYLRVFKFNENTLALSKNITEELLKNLFNEVYSRFSDYPKFSSNPKIFNDYKKLFYYLIPLTSLEKTEYLKKSMEIIDRYHLIVENLFPGSLPSSEKLKERVKREVTRYKNYD